MHTSTPKENGGTTNGNATQPHSEIQLPRTGPHIHQDAKLILGIREMDKIHSLEYKKHGIRPVSVVVRKTLLSKFFPFGVQSQSHRVESEVKPHPISPELTNGVETVLMKLDHNHKDEPTKPDGDSESKSPKLSNGLNGVVPPPPAPEAPDANSASNGTLKPDCESPVSPVIITSQPVAENSPSIVHPRPAESGIENFDLTSGSELIDTSTVALENNSTIELRTADGEPLLKRRKTLPPVPPRPSLKPGRKPKPKVAPLEDSSDDEITAKNKQQENRTLRRHITKLDFAVLFDMKNPKPSTSAALVSEMARLQKLYGHLNGPSSSEASESDNLSPESNRRPTRSNFKGIPMTAGATPRPKKLALQSRARSNRLRGTQSETISGKEKVPVKRKLSLPESKHSNKISRLQKGANESAEDGESIPTTRRSIRQVLNLSLNESNSSPVKKSSPQPQGVACDSKPSSERVQSVKPKSNPSKVNKTSELVRKRPARPPRNAGNGTQRDPKRSLAKNNKRVSRLKNDSKVDECTAIRRRKSQQVPRPKKSQVGSSQSRKRNKAEEKEAGKNVGKSAGGIMQNDQVESKGNTDHFIRRSVRPRKLGAVSEFL